MLVVVARSQRDAREARFGRAAGTDTQERLLEAAMRLFAERGYDRATVGEIERAAGLSPRSGALYQYFAGKEELLHAAVERELSAVDELSSVIETLPESDLRSALTQLAEWNLASLLRRQTLNRFLAREADRLPPALRSKVYDRLVARPYEQVFELLKSQMPATEQRRFDPEALALIFVQAMAGYRSMHATFGKVVGGVDDKRFVRSWVEVALAVARDAGLDRARRQ
jgi:AcrR family transcriptional regulator